jgi:hypothetical protein
MYLAPQDNYMPPLPSRDYVTIRHPGQVPQSGTRAGIHKGFDCIANAPASAFPVVRLSRTG